MTDKIYTIKELNTLDYQNTDLKIGDTVVARASMVKMWEHYPDRPDQPQMILQDPKQIIEQEALSAPGNQEPYKAYCNSALPVWLGALQPAPWLQYLGNQPIGNIVTQCWTLRLESKSKVRPPRWVLDTTEAATGPSFFTAPEPISIPLEAAMWNTQLNWVPMLVTGNVVEVYESFNALTLEKRVMLGDSISSYRMNIILNVDPYTPVEWLPGLIGMNAKSVPIIPQLWSSDGSASVGISDDLSYFRTAGLIKEHTYDMHMPDPMPTEHITLPTPEEEETGNVTSPGDLQPSDIRLDAFESGKPEVSEETDESSQDSVLSDASSTPSIGSYLNDSDLDTSRRGDGGDDTDSTVTHTLESQNTNHGKGNRSSDDEEEETTVSGTNCLLDYYREEMVKYEKLKQDHETLQGQYASACQNELAIENERLRRLLALTEEKMDSDRMRRMPPRDKEEELLKRRKKQQRLEYEKNLSEQAAEEQIKRELAQAEASLLEGEDEGNS